MAFRNKSVNISSIFIDAVFNISLQSIIPVRACKAPRPSCLCAVLWFIHPLPSLHWFQYSPGIFIYFSAL